MKVAVIGAGGHVGLPFSLVVGAAGHKVIGVDTNGEIINQLYDKHYPYMEVGGQELLDSSTVDFMGYMEVDRFKLLREQEVIAIMLGTPIDAENNPRLDAIMDFVETQLIPNYVDGQLIILRSTVSPGTTELIRNTIQKALGKREGMDFYLVFCPERVAQGVAIAESKKFPQLVGAFTYESFDKAKEFFDTFIENDCIFLTPEEAELGKLMTNMYRYVTIALANEFYMIGQEYRNVDVHKITKAINLDYPRMNLPLPGPNVGGPCLFKDGKFLTQNIPYADLIQTSFLINEGMPQFIMNILKERYIEPHSLMIMGMTFKADNDDTRNSLSFKLRKLCRAKGIQTVEVDPYLHDITKVEDWLRIDAIVVMTPHTGFQEFYNDTIKKRCGSHALVIDIWKYLDDSKKTTNGIFELGMYQ